MSLLASVLNTIAEVVFSHSLQEGIRNILWHGSHFNLRHSLSLVMFKCTSQYTTCTNILVVRCFLFYFIFLHLIVARRGCELNSSHYLLFRDDLMLTFGYIIENLAIMEQN